MPGTGNLIQSAGSVDTSSGGPAEIALPSAPITGNLCVTVCGKDKSFGGAPTSPSGHALRAFYDGTSTGTGIADASSGANGGSWDWTNVNGASVAIAEFDMQESTFVTGGAFPNPATDTSVTTITGSLGNASVAGYVFAAFSTDSSWDNGGTFPTTGTITHTGWERIVGPVQGPASGVAPSNGGANITLLRKAVNVGDSTSLTVSWTGAADQCGLVMSLYGWTATATDPVRTVAEPWLGVDKLVVKTSSSVAGETARVAFSTSSTMTSPIYSSSLVTPDGNGRSKHSLPTTLTSATAYWYQVELGGVLIGSPQPFRTLVAPGGQNSYSFGIGSCRDVTNPVTLNNAVSRGIAFFLHMGDLHYNNIATNSPSLFRSAYDESLAQSATAAMIKAVPTAYTWSDHDFGGNDSDSTSAAKPAAQSVYRERVPHVVLPSTTSGIYHTFKIGRVRYVMLDTRSYASPSGNTDNSSKVKIGTEQRTWLQNILATADSPLTCIVSAEPWIASVADNDHWGSYQNERSIIGGYITASPTKVVFFCGDAHMLAYDSGVNAVGGTPVYHAAALASPNPSTKGGPYSGGTLQGTGQYGFMEVTDSGSQIALKYSGIKSDGTVWATHTTTVSLTQTLSPTQIPSISTIFTPSITRGSINVSLQTLTNSSTVFLPSRTAGPVAVSPAVLNNAVLTTVYGPTLVTGSVSTIPQRIENVSIIYGPTTSNSPVQLRLVRLENTIVSQVYSPSVTVGSVNRTFQLLSNSSVVYTPQISSYVFLLLERHTNQTAFFAPIVTVQSVNLSFAHLVSNAIVYNPSVSVGVVSREPVAILNTSIVYTPTIAVDDGSIQSVSIDSTGVIFRPTLTLDQIVINVNRVESTAIVYPISVTFSDIETIFDRIESTSVVFTFEVNFSNIEFNFLFIDSSSVIYEPTVYRSGELPGPPLIGEIYGAISQTSSLIGIVITDSSKFHGRISTETGKIRSTIEISVPLVAIVNLQGKIYSSTVTTYNQKTRSSVSKFSLFGKVASELVG